MYNIIIFRISIHLIYLIVIFIYSFIQKYVLGTRYVSSPVLTTGQIDSSEYRNGH